MPAIEANEIGVFITTDDSQPNEEPMVMRWSEIDTILAYKRDVFAYDLICLAFADQNRVFETHEEMVGWRDLIDELPTRLPGIPTYSEWFDKVAQPPFATNRTTLFSR